MFGANVQIVQGYKGSNEITLALRRGEVGATCGLYVANALTQLKDDLESGNMTLFIQFGRKSHPEFGNAVNIYDLLKTDEDRQVVDIIFRPNEIGRPVVAPPGIPSDLTTALRNAFMKTMEDPGLIEEARKLRLPVSPTTGESVAELFKSFYTAPKRLIDRAVAIMNTE
jgi:tripartite-type tricarboxylate transporter receptor subunit TctC